jgi:hypothetical protein
MRSLGLLRVWGLGLRFRVWAAGFRIHDYDLRFRVVQGLVFGAE